MFWLLVHILTIRFYLIKQNRSTKARNIGELLYFKMPCVYCCQLSCVYCCQLTCVYCCQLSCVYCCQLSCVYCCQLSCVYCCQMSCVYCCSYRVCIVVILCVFVVLCLYCCFYFRCWTAGQKSVSRKVLRPATSAQVFLGFPVSISKC